MPAAVVVVVVVVSVENPVKTSLLHKTEKPHRHRPAWLRLPNRQPNQALELSAMPFQQKKFRFKSRTINPLPKFR